MHKAYLALRNTAAKNIIARSGLFEISSDASEKQQVVFTDNLKDSGTTEGTMRVYVAVHRLEYTFDMAKFVDFDFLLCFGKYLYDELVKESEVFNFEPSKVYDGFIVDEETEDAAEEMDMDVLIVMPEIITPFSATCFLNMIDALNIVASEWRELRIVSNTPCDPLVYLKSVGLDQNTEAYEIDRQFMAFYNRHVCQVPFDSNNVPAKHINSARFVFTVDPNMARWYSDWMFSQRKLILTGTMEGMIQQAQSTMNFTSATTPESLSMLGEAIGRDIAFAVTGPDKYKAARTLRSRREFNDLQVLHDGILGKFTQRCLFSQNRARLASPALLSLLELKIPGEKYMAMKDVTPEFLETLGKIATMELPTT